MAAFEELLLELQKAVKEAGDGKVGASEKALELSAKLQAFAGAQAQTAYVVNISDQRFHVPRTYYNIWIEGCEEGEDYHCTELHSVVDHMDMGLGVEGTFDPKTGRRGRLRTVPVPFSAEQIAEDVVKQINGNISEGAFVGAFVSLTSKPEPAALKDAQKRFRKFQEESVHKADMSWAMKPDHRMIPDFARRSLQSLGWERDWYMPVQPDWVDCPACGAKIRPNLAKCPVAGCGAILDVDKCVQFGIPVPEGMLKKPTQRQKEA